MNISENPRKLNIQVRVTQAEKRAIANKAKARGLSVAAYIRTIALSAEK